jgi:cobalt-zinc-cadmium resistance protein CzcA
MELRTIQDWIIRRQLLGTPGVAEVNSFGGFLKQYEIALDPDKLKGYGLTISDVFNALEQNNQNTGGSYIDKKPNAYFIRTEGLIGSLEDINQIVVNNTSKGTPVLIRDIGTAQFGQANRYGALTRNDKEAVGAIVMMLKGENSNTVVNRVKERMTQIEKTLPEGISVEAFLDRSNLVGRAINTVTKNLIEGALIVIFVLVLFLGNLRAGLVVASVIPLSMLFAISMMYLFGVSGNLMSLGAIDFGLIVDGAVIIVEATMHHLAISKVAKLTQDEMDNEVYESASKIRTSAAFGEIIILIVYLPILALVGIEGKMFGPMAQTVAFAILGAFILSLTYVPMASALFLSKNVHRKRNISDRLMDFFQKIYAPVIRRALKTKGIVVSIAVGLLLLSLFAFSRMGGEFIPTLEEGDFAIETRLLTGSSLSQTVDKITQASDLLMKKFPEVKEVVGKIGAAELPTDPMPMEATDITVMLKEKSEWTSAKNREELAEKMSEALEAIPGVSFGFSQPIQLRTNELISGVRQDVGVKIFGEDLEELTRLSEKIGKIVSSVEGAEDLYLEKVTGLPQIVVSIDRERVAKYGLSIGNINQAVNAAFAGQTAGVVYEGEKRFDLVVRLEKENRNDIEDVRGLFIPGANGIQIPLENIADVEFKQGPNQIQREDAKRRIIVGFNVRGRDVASVVEELQEKIQAQIEFPVGYFVTYGGQFENLQEAKSRLSVAVPIALLLIFLLLFFTFGSVKQSILIFTAIPMAAIGGVFALLLRGMPFSISAGVGFIALFGVAVLNGIVLIAEFNRLRKEGLTDLYEIILKGTSIRLRPVLMTATVASLGFLPMALSNTAGAEVQKPLATVVIGGLITSTLLTLIVLPVLYIYFEKGIRLKSKILMFSLVFFLPLFAIGQQVPKRYSLEQSIETALKNNKTVESSRYNVEYSKASKRASLDFPKTNVSGTFGQYNSYEKRDNNITVSQTIPFPTQFGAQLGLADARIKGSELQLTSTENELTYQVKSAYYELAYLQELNKWLQKQDTLYSSFVKAAQVRYQVGETNLLESITAESQAQQTKTQLQQSLSNIRILQTRLQTLLNENDAVEIEEDSLKEKVLHIPEDDSLKNPLLAWYKQQVLISQKEKQVEKNKLLPDLTLGYFNQTLIGTPIGPNTAEVAGTKDRFQGFQVGVSIPLYWGAQSARVKAADFSQKSAESTYQAQLKSLQGNIAEAHQELSKHQESLNYYRNSLLPKSTLILSQSEKAYRAGEIGYLEFLQGLRTTAEIRSGYLEILNNYNQAVIRLEYILGIHQ